MAAEIPLRCDPFQLIRFVGPEQVMQARFEEGVLHLQQSLHVLREELSEHQEPHQVSRPLPSWNRVHID